MRVDLDSNFIDVDFIKPLGNTINNQQENQQITGPSFSSVMTDIVEATNATERQDNETAMNLLSGQVNDLHTVGLAAEKADLALQLTLQIRNKVLDAYNEILRMQV